jgi:deazaflavin-dependent oxidoreductase (nitroreductase family)
LGVKRVDPLGYIGKVRSLSREDKANICGRNAARLLENFLLRRAKEKSDEDAPNDRRTYTRLQSPSYGPLFVGWLHRPRRVSPDLDPHYPRSEDGREVSTPLLYIEENEKLYIVASFGGNDSHPGWYRNLVANPEVKVERNNESRRYHTRSLSTEEADKVWPKLLALYPSYADYRKKTVRVIPVVELTLV